MKCVLRQKVNASKSYFMMHAKFLTSKKAIVSQITGFCSKEFPVRYLGYNLFVGRRKKQFFSNTCNLVISRVHSWKNRFLSMESNITLSKTIVSSMPIYLLATASLPKSILQSLESIFANFLWG